MKRIVLFLLLLTCCSYASAMEHRRTKDTYRFDFDNSEVPQYTVYSGDWHIGNPEKVEKVSVDFSDTSLNAKKGIWKLENGKYFQEEEGMSSTTSSYADGIYEDFKLSFDVIPKSEENTLMIYFGYQNVQNYHSIEINSYQSKLIFDGEETTGTGSILKDNEYHVEFLSDNGEVSLYCDSELIFSKKLDKTVSGSVGIGTWNSKMEFDNFEIAKVPEMGIEDKLTGKSKDEGVLLFDDIIAGDFLSNVRVASDEISEMGVVFRAGENTDGYYAVIDKTSAYIAKKEDGKKKVLKRVPFKARSKRFYLMSVMADKDTLSLYIDDELILDVNDNSFESGKFGFYHSKSEVYYEDTDISLLTESAYPIVSDGNAKSDKLTVELGILKNYEDGTFRGDLNVTNGEFIDAMLVMTGFTDEKSLVEAGYMREGLILTEPLRNDDMIYAFVKLLKYPENDYLKWASEAGLYKNVRITDEYIARDAFSECIYNVLTTDKFTVESLNGNEVVLSKRGNILKERFNIERLNGIVTANETASLDGSSKLNKGEFLINGITVKSDINTADYLGRRVEAFAEFNENSQNYGKLVFIQKYKNDEITVVSEYIDGDTTNNKLVWVDYATEKIKSKKITGDAAVVRNGINIGKAKDLYSSMFTPGDGDVTLTDNNGDGNTDVVLIWDYTTYVVDYVNLANEIIYDKSGRTVNLKDRDYSVYNEKGKKILIEDVKPLSVLSIADNGEEIIIISSNKEPAKGVYHREGYSVKVGSDKYSLNGYCDLRKVANGDFVSVYLDKYDRASYIVKEDEYQYAFLEKTYYSDEDGENLIFKMYTLNDEAVKKTAADSLTVTSELGKTKYRRNRGDMKNYKVLYNLIDGKQEPVKYKTNTAGEIRELVFATSKIGYEMSDGTDIFEAYYGISTGGKINSREAKFIRNKFVSKYIVTPETVILSLEKKEEKTDSERIRRLTTADLTDDSDYYVRIYDVNEKFEAGMVVIDRVDDWYTKLGSIVSNVSHVLDDEGEECLSFEIYTSGEKSVILADNPDMQTDSSVAGRFENAGTKLSEITVGDVIYYKLDTKGKVSAFAVLHKNNNRGFYHRSNYGWGGNYIPNAAMAVTYFNVIKTYSDLIIAEIDGARPIEEYEWRNYYIVENGKMRKAEFSDVKPTDKVVGLWKWSNMNDMIIYR